MDEALESRFTEMNWEQISSQARADIIEMSYHAKAAHLASALSCVDIMTVLYASILNVDSTNYDSPDRDRFILSKGHAATALYALLAWKGLIKHDDLKNYGQKGSFLEEHPSPKQIGVEAATGSLGHGLAIGNGMALSTRITGRDFRVFVLMSDGECNEGSVWEAAMFGSQYKLHNLTAIVDYNKWQATGRSKEILKLHSLSEKWASFGWNVAEIDGHDHQVLFDELSKNENHSPKMIIAHTVKGKGVSFMEDDNNWHYRVPTLEELNKAKLELGMK